MYIKNFDEWNGKKIKIDKEVSNQQCHNGEIWMVSVGVNIGKEVDGKGEVFARPVLVIKRCNKDTFIGIPLTKTKKDSKWYVPLIFEGIDGSLNISQIRLFDQKRLLRLRGLVSKEEFKLIKSRIRNLFV